MASKKTAKRAGRKVPADARKAGGREAAKRSAVRKPKSNSRRENLSQCEAPKDEGDEPLALETIRAMLGSNIEGWRTKQGKLEYYDLLLKTAKLEPKQGMPAIEQACDFARQAIHSLIFWARASHVPEAAGIAQLALADIMHFLRSSNFFKRLEMPAAKYGKVFESRWRTLVPKSRGGSQYAALSLFMMELQAKENEVLSQMVVDHPKPIPESAPSYVKNVAPIVEELISNIIPQVLRPGTELEVSFVVKRVKKFMRGHSNAQLWTEFYEPLAREIWPAFAREHVEFKGWKSGLGKGLPLSKRKRTVDDRPDLGFKGVATRIKTQVFEWLESERSFFGDGLKILPDGEAVMIPGL